MGTFTGATIPNASTIKAALQSVETAYEETDVNANDLITLSGVAENATHLGTFTGSIVADSSTVKVAFQALETDLEALQTASGIAAEATHLGTFTGATIADSSTIKIALQAIETSLEEIDVNVNDLITLTGIAENTTTTGGAPGSIISDGTILTNLRELEAAIELTQLVATGTITTGEILALNATPKTLIASPGANNVIVVDEIQLFLDFNTAAYVADAGEDITFQYATGNTVVASIDNDNVVLLTAVADAHWIGRPNALYDVQAAGTGDGILLTNIDDEAIEVTIAAGEVITGDSPILWKIKYHIVTYLT